MSWSINLMGTPSRLRVALESHSTRLVGKSKEEYDEALPKILELIKLNTTAEGEPIVSISANGHKFDTELGTTASLNVDIQRKDYVVV